MAKESLNARVSMRDLVLDSSVKPLIKVHHRLWVVERDAPF
jgi:hypothetical protein